MGRSKGGLLVTVLLTGAVLAAPASAEIVVLSGGGFLKVSDYRVEGSRVTVTFTSGGELRLPLARVERIVADEIVEEPEDDRGKPGTSIRLDHRAQDPTPAVPFGEHMRAVAERVDLNPALLAAMARAESAFDAGAVSPKGARGLMQVMPATGRRFGAEPAQLFDPQVNLDAAGRYLAWLRERFADDLDLILAAYNAGEATVDRYQGVPPYRETRDYIRRVRSYLGEWLDQADAVLR